MRVALITSKTKTCKNIKIPRVKTWKNLFYTKFRLFWTKNPQNKIFLQKMRLCHFNKLHDTLTSCEKSENLCDLSGESFRTNGQTDKRTECIPWRLKTGQRQCQNFKIPNYRKLETIASSWCNERLARCVFH